MRERRLVEVKRLIDRGNECYGRSDLEGAKRNLEAAVEISRQSGERMGEASALHCLGMVCSTDRRPKEAIAYLEEALAILRDLWVPEIQEMRRETLRGMTDVCRVANWHERSLPYFQDLLTLDQEMGDRSSQSTTMHNMALQYGQLGQHKKALKILEQALEIARDMGDRIAEARMLASMGQVQAQLGDYAAADKSLKGALRIFEEYFYRADQLEVYNSLGLIKSSHDVKEYEAALDHFNKALAILEEIGSQAGLDYRVQKGIILNNLGMLYSGHIGDNAKALECFEEALAYDREWKNEESELLTHHNLALVYRRMGETAEALRHLGAADEIIEKLRPEVLDEKLRIAFLGRLERVYGHYVSLLAAQSEYEPALEIIEKSKARSFLLQLSGGDFLKPSLPADKQGLFDREKDLIDEGRVLENQILDTPDEAERNRLRGRRIKIKDALDELREQLESLDPDYVALRRGAVISYEDMQELVDGQGLDTALVAFFTPPEPDILDQRDQKVFVFVLRSGHEKPVFCDSVEFSKGRMDALLRNFLSEVSGYHPEVRERELLWHEGAKPLLTGALPLLKGAELVYLVPHGQLHYLPLHALRIDDGTDDDTCLIDRFPIVYAPSISVLDRVMKRAQEGRRAFSQSDVLVFGYDDRIDTRQYLIAEAEQVARHFGTRARLDGEANGEFLRKQAGDYDILHLSCHGQYEVSDPLKSHIQLADGRFSVRDVMNIRLKANLVTLSACQTGIGGQMGISQEEAEQDLLPEHLLRIPGDELTSLPRALLNAGASSAMVTLWKSHAPAAKVLMDTFYQCLYEQNELGTINKAAALREAMLKTRSLGPPEEQLAYDHTYYWAPFILVGDWR